MKHRICLAFLIGCCVAISHAQDCDAMLKTARTFKTQSDYRHAIEQYLDVLKNCGDEDGNVLQELKVCVERNIDRSDVFQPEEPLLECGGEGGTFALELKKAPFSWSVSQVPEWMQVTSAMTEEKRVLLYVNANPNAEFRSGIIELSTDNGRKQEFLVVQLAGEEHFSVQKDKLSFEGGGGRQNVKVDANFKWNYHTSATWLQLIQQNDLLYVNCLANDLVAKRSATITISGKEASKNILVTQSEGETRLRVSSSSITFDAAGGEDNTLKVSCNDSWRVDNSYPWITVDTSGESLVVRCKANPLAESRTASFDVVTWFEGVRKTVVVEQQGAEPRLDRISLPSAGGERSVSDVRPHFRTVFLKGNKGDMKVKVYSNVPNWEYSILSNGEEWITAEASPRDSLLKLTLADNNGWDIREADIVISAMGLQDTLHIRQNKRGYRGIWDDYFSGPEMTWKTTKFFVDLYAGQAFGFRIGGLAKRWKAVEFSLLNFDVEYTFTDFLLDWEPIVRGYLPLSRDGHRWALFMGLGVSVNVFDLALKPVKFSYFDDANFLFEIGAEFHWTKKDNISSRIFYRYDGYSSIGFSFDFYQWTEKYSLKK